MRFKKSSYDNKKANLNYLSYPSLTTDNSVPGKQGTFLADFFCNLPKR